jgi:hypothetical protein
VKKTEPKATAAVAVKLPSVSVARRFAMNAIGQHRRDTAKYGQWRYLLWTGDPGLAVYLSNCLAGTDRFPTMDNFFGL